MTLFNIPRPGFALQLCFFAFVVSAVLLSPASRAAPANGMLPQFQYSTQASTTVIEYNLVHEMLAEPDAVPLLRIYGNGRVHVHVPAYMKNAGDYEIQLKRNELDAIVLALSQDGVIDFDHSSIRKNLSRLNAQRLAATGTLWQVSDVTETVIEVNLDRYQRSPASTPVNGLKKSFSWKSLQLDARRYPESIAIQRAAASARMLHAVIQRPDLKRMSQ
ncbi:MAG: hypothetical protein BMS9Abin09_1058 [Gammaproteobacteria bacterium]|nr:MAG: hypothetical protein BMS9Abin09_1058 [Gammaproteobacteria bacterium]